MSWILKDKPKTMRATRELGRRFSEMEKAPGDRDLREHRLVVYERAMKRGEFRPVTWATCYCKETDATYRVNGKHTSTLIASLDPTPELYVVVEHYEGDTLEDVSKLYSTFDSKEQSRSAADVNRSFASAIRELDGVPSGIINLAVSGIAYSDHLEGSSSLGAADRAEALFDHQDFVVWLYDLLGAPNREYRFMGRMPVVAAMFQCYTRSRREASRFWQAVRDGTGEKPDLPDRWLARWLMMAKTDRGRHDRHSDKKSANNREFLSRCLCNWNAWRKNRPAMERYYVKAEMPTAV